MADKQSPKLNQAAAANRQDVSTGIDFALKQFQLFETNQQLPARIISFDRARNLATVQPLIMFTTTSGDLISRDQIVEVPVVSLGGGGFHISFPLKPNDLGWIIAADRDISLFVQTLKESKAPTQRSHQFGDSVFIPDVFRKYTVAGEDSDAMVIQSVDGATKISIHSDNIVIATNKVLVRAPESEFTGNVKVVQNLTVGGETNVNGGFTSAAGQPCTLPATTTVAGKQVDTHTHAPGTYRDGQGASITGNSAPF
ncbi:baseplate central spike [Burkholderia phage Maja]|uniref:Baseplate central spike n=1 Tax=Burkholderia phage Maja TaxID=2767571 RepID=A0A7S6R763_9CAUD|nr:baseplate central spike [Burkholderia phage Maja]